MKQNFEILTFGPIRKYWN